VQELLLVAEPNVVDSICHNTLPPDWYTRDCYFGTEGAKAWLGTMNDPTYEPESQRLAVQGSLLEAVDKIDVRTFISFGPGDAKQDENLVKSLHNKESWLQYIPIDISDGLLEGAVNRLKEHVRVPVGILGDFEDRLAFISRIVRKYATGPLLLSILGNTIGNLDRYEYSFLAGARNLMKKGDYLLLDFSIAGPKWTLTKDRRGEHKGYGTGYRRFIATGVSRRHGRSVDSVIRYFTRDISFSAPIGRSDIPETNTIFIEFRPPGMRAGRLVYSIRRYKWEAICKWLTTKFKFKIEFSAPIMIDDIIGDGVLLLRAI
jgi:hypothetical protein